MARVSPLCQGRAMTLPRTGAVRHEDELGRFEHLRCVPSPRLAGIALGYLGYSHRTVRPLRRHEPAQDKVTLIFNLGPPLRVGGPRFATTDVGSFIAPLSDTYALTEEGRASYGLQVDLSPLGTYMLLGASMESLSDVVVPLADAIGPIAPLLVEQLFQAPSWEARFELIERFFLRRLEDARQPSPDVAWAWRRLSETSGRLAIGTLAEELGSSKRHLAARFREQIGLTPKTAARIMRFQRAARQLALDDGRRFAEIASGCGYFDQAHLNRDFRELGGKTPSAFLASRRPAGFGVSA